MLNNTNLRNKSIYFSKPLVWKRRVLLCMQCPRGWNQRNKMVRSNYGRKMYSYSHVHCISLTNYSRALAPLYLVILESTCLLSFAVCPLQSGPLEYELVHFIFCVPSTFQYSGEYTVLLLLCDRCSSWAPLNWPPCALAGRTCASACDPPVRSSNFASSSQTLRLSITSSRSSAQRRQLLRASAQARHRARVRLRASRRPRALRTRTRSRIATRD